jgi:WD40 repeat protein
LQLSGIVLATALLTGPRGSAVAPPEKYDPFVPRALAVSPDGRLVATAQLTNRGSPGGETTVREVGTGKVLHKVRWPKRTPAALAFSPDGRLLALAGGDNVQAGVWASRVEVVEAATGRRICRADSEKGIAVHIIFSPDARLLGVRYEHGITGAAVDVLNAATGKVEKSIDLRQLKVGGKTVPLGLAWPAFGRGGHLLLAPWSRGKVFDGEGKGAYQVELRQGIGICAVIVSRDGGHVALIEQTTVPTPGEGGPDYRPGVFHVGESGPGGKLRAVQGHGKQVLAAAFSADGRRLVTGSLDGTVKVWEVESGREAASFPGHGSRVLGVAFGFGGRRVVAAYGDDRIKVWNPAR